MYLDNYFKNRFGLKVNYNKINNKYNIYQVSDPNRNGFLGLYILDNNQNVAGYIIFEWYEMGTIKKDTKNYNILMNPILSLSQNNSYTSNINNLYGFELNTYENKKDNYIERFIILDKIKNPKPHDKYIYPIVGLQSFYPDELEGNLSSIISSHLQYLVDFNNIP